MILYATLAVAAAIAARLVARYDLHDREPWPLIAAVILAGGAAMALAGPIEDSIIRRAGAGAPAVALIAAVAATVEELGRFGIVLALAWLVPRHFNDPIDGLIYGSSAGIGMALEETTAYLAADASAPLAGTLAVEAVRLFGHVIMGGITGFGVGVMHHRRARRVWAALAVACLAGGVAIHFLWDYVALTNLMRADWDTEATAASITLMLVAMAAYGGLVVAGGRASREIFAISAPRRPPIPPGRPRNRRPRP